MPVQYVDLIRRGHVRDGETRLMFAVLADAVLCYVKDMKCETREGRERFIEVEGWIETRGVNCSSGSPFSFENVCDAVGIEPGSLRKWLAAIRAGEATAEIRRFRRKWTATHRTAASLCRGH